MIKGNSEWWFLYEGPFGGEVDAADFVQRSDGPTTTYDGTFHADMPGDEWMYAADPADGRSFFMAHHEDDGAVESYRLLDGPPADPGLRSWRSQPQLPVHDQARSASIPRRSRSASSTRPHSVPPATTSAAPTRTCVDHRRRRRVPRRRQRRHQRRLQRQRRWLRCGPSSIPRGDSHARAHRLRADGDPAGRRPSTTHGPAPTPRSACCSRSATPTSTSSSSSTRCPSQRFESQGLLFQQDAQNWVRFIADHDGTRARVNIQKMVDGVASIVESKNLPGVSTRYLRGDPHRRRVDVPSLVQRHKWYDMNASYTLPLDLDATRHHLRQHGFSDAGVHRDRRLRREQDQRHAQRRRAQDHQRQRRHHCTPRHDHVDHQRARRHRTPVGADDQPHALESESLAMVTEHSVTIDFLRCDVPYFFRSQVAKRDRRDDRADGDVPHRHLPHAGLRRLQRRRRSARTGRCTTRSATRCSSLSDTNAIISVPAGQEHNLFPGENLATRLRQEAPLGNFGVDAKFDSVLSSRFQTQGIVVEEDLNNYLRFEIHHNGTGVRFFLASIIDNVATVQGEGALPAGTQHHLRVDAQRRDVDRVPFDQRHQLDPDRPDGDRTRGHLRRPVHRRHRDRRLAAAGVHRLDRLLLRRPTIRSCPRTAAPDPTPRRRR